MWKTWDYAFPKPSRRGNALDLEDVGRARNTSWQEDLTPSDTATLSSKTVAGILTEHWGGPTSHTAIIARLWKSRSVGHREPLRPD
jgi:hypothetical protein